MWRAVSALELVLATGWGVFWLGWLVVAFATKKGRVSWVHHVRVRALMALMIVVMARTGVLSGQGHGHRSDPWRATGGLALWAAGLGFAVWARVHIGRNWGVPMTRKEEPELVTSGPYRLVRHPIYSGILVAGIGTAVALTWVLLIVTAVAGAYFVYSATVEERYLTEEFPDAYPAYQLSTKMLLPYIF